MENKVFKKECAYVNCGNPFETDNAKQKFCSKTCRTYNTQIKNGTLNKTQQALLDGKIKKKSKKEQRTPEDKFRDEILKSYLDDLIDNRDDLFYFLENSILTPNGNFIMQSTAKEEIEDIKDKFEGSNIFTGKVSIVYLEYPEIPDIIDTIGYSSFDEGNRKQDYFVTQQHISNEEMQTVINKINGEHTKRLRFVDKYRQEEKYKEKRSMRVYKTLLKREVVISNSEIPVEEF